MEKNLIADNKRILNKTKIHDLNGVSFEVPINSSISELKNIYPDFEFIERLGSNNYKWE
jgi:hypothetical protein